jgi:hypothetical protein
VNARQPTGSRPLHWAAEENHVETVRALLELGADVEAVLVDGRTALQLCTSGGPVHALLREHRLEATRKRRDLRNRATPSISSRDLASATEDANRMAALLIAEEEEELAAQKKKVCPAPFHARSRGWRCSAALGSACSCRGMRWVGALYAGQGEEEQGQGAGR